MTYYSQNNQDSIIDDLLDKKSNGIFIDIGANDGVSLSNSFFFEQFRNWKGICIEPIPELFEQLRSNRKCHVINGAVSTYTGKIQFNRVHGYSEMLSGILEYQDQEHEKRILREMSLYGGKSQIIDVPCYTLREVLNSYSITHVDYLSLDIEGGEYEILENFDFDSVNISCLTVENNYGDKRIHELLKKNNYKLIFNHNGDDFYINGNLFSLIDILLNRRFLFYWAKWKLKKFKKILSKNI